VLNDPATAQRRPGPSVNAHGVRTGFRTFGPDNQTALIAESLLDSRTLIGHGER
jgi:hypothetical protein